MEAAAGKRELSGDKAQRIVDAMRSSVAVRGIAGSTFEHVAREAGVAGGSCTTTSAPRSGCWSRSSAATRRSASPASTRPSPARHDVDDVLDVLVSNLTETIENDPGVFALLFEVFSAGRRNPEIQREVADLFRRTRDNVAEALEAKRAGGCGRACASERQRPFPT